MNRINYPRVLIGGLVAGLVINVSESTLNMSVLGPDVMALSQKLGLPPMAMNVIYGYLGLGFLLGIAMVWLYAVARAHFGPGSNTATKIGFAAWFLAYAFHGLGAANMGMMSWRSSFIGLVWQLAECILAANVGGYLYKEAA